MYHYNTETPESQYDRKKFTNRGVPYRETPVCEPEKKTACPIKEQAVEKTGYRAASQKAQQSTPPFFLTSGGR